MTGPLRVVGHRVSPLRAAPGYDGRLRALLEVLRRAEVPCEVELPSGERFEVRWPLPPKRPKAAWFRLVLRNHRPLRGPLNELTLGRAYVQGDLDVVLLAGDELSVFKLRRGLRHGMTPAQALALLSEIAIRSPVRANAGAIAGHYNLPDDFHLTFLDRTYRFYSQCRFEQGDETLEEAAELRARHMSRTLGLKPGDHILDVGGGWGGLTEFCGKRRVRVTSLTLTEQSAAYIQRIIDTKNPDSEVLVEDVLEHRVRGRYDHVVIFGVVEHIPTYARLCTRLWEVLKPEGRVYLDASATRQKYAASAFTRAFTWPGPHSCMAVQDLVQEFLFHGFDVEHVHNDSRDYELTMRAWGRRLDHANRRGAFARRWGESLYRQYRVYLWGGAEGFRSGGLQAYTVVARRREDPGPRPGLGMRVGQFAASLR